MTAGAGGFSVRRKEETMTLELIRTALGWCSLINFGILLVWVLVFVTGRGCLYRLHSRMFAITEERFNAIHYAGMAGYKLLILVFNLVPWIVLHIVG
jgi:hypothetical protein